MMKNIFYAVATIVLIMGAALFYQRMQHTELLRGEHSYQETPATQQADIPKVELHPLSAEAIKKELAASGGKPALLFLYASWCPYCKKQFPIIEELSKSGYHIIPVSVDKDAAALATFLGKNHPHTPLAPYIAENSGDIMTWLGGLGLSYRGSIPYMVAFSGQGTPVKHFQGLTAREPLEQALKAP